MAVTDLRRQKGAFTFRAERLTVGTGIYEKGAPMSLMLPIDLFRSPGKVVDAQLELENLSIEVLRPEDASPYVMTRPRPFNSPPVDPPSVQLALRSHGRGAVRVELMDSENRLIAGCYLTGPLHDGSFVYYWLEEQQIVDAALVQITIYQQPEE